MEWSPPVQVQCPQNCPLGVDVIAAPAVSAAMKVSVPGLPTSGFTAPQQQLTLYGSLCSSCLNYTGGLYVSVQWSSQVSLACSIWELDIVFQALQMHGRLLAAASSSVNCAS